MGLKTDLPYIKHTFTYCYEAMRNGGHRQNLPDMQTQLDRRLRRFDFEV